MIITVLFACLALVLAGVGIYGVVSDVATQRTHEIGVRIALGAPARHAMRLIIGQATSWILWGVILGLAGTLALSRFLSSLLFGVKQVDVASFLYASILLCGVTVLACYLPGRRVMRVDPAIALRHE
jgi:putative ABC transport system permease protein